MQACAKLKYLRIAPRKVRLTADLIRGKSVQDAEALLNFTIKKASLPLLKLLKSAAANAKSKFQLPESNLYVQKILVDEGPKLKRWRARARGQAYEIQKKSSHVTIVLEEIKKGTKTEKTEESGKPKEEAEIAAAAKTPKQKFEPKTWKERPKFERGMRRIFRRKAF